MSIIKIKIQLNLIFQYFSIENIQVVQYQEYYIRLSQDYNIIKMANQQTIKDLLTEINKLRVKLSTNLPQQAQNYLQFQHSKLMEPTNSFFSWRLCGNPTVQVSEKFKRAFQTLTQIEKTHYYFHTLKNFNLILNSQNSENNQLKSKHFVDNIKQGNEVAKCIFAIKSTWIFKKWQTVNVQLLKAQKIIRIPHRKLQIDLHDYVLRKSKTKPNICIVLQSTESNPLGNSIWLSCETLQNQVNLQLIVQLWKESYYEKCSEMVATSRNTTTLSSTLSIKPLVEISQNCLIQQKSTLKIIQSLHSFQQFKQVSKGIFYEKNGYRVRKIFNFRKGIKAETIKVFLKDVQKTKIFKHSLVNAKKIEESITQIIKERHYFADEDIEYLYKRYFLMYHSVQYIIQKSFIENKEGRKYCTIFQGQIHHCIWRIREIEDSVELTVQALIAYQQNKKYKAKDYMKFTSDFIGQLQKILSPISKKTSINQNIIQPDIQANHENEQQIQQFFTLPAIMDEEFFQLGEDSLNFREFKSISLNTSLSIEQNQTFLKHKFIEVPQEKGEKILMHSEKGHCLWENEWQIRQNGELVNINKQKIAIQSSVLKLVVKNIGKNLLAGKSILNMSLPIQIFGTDSNVERLTRGYIYAPVFLQKAAALSDPLERMKYVVCFGLGFSLSYIKMEKPFNPILGETYQGMVDGCPVYAQQISHHPPISSLLMLGRGYRIYGSFQAKVEMGMNSASGINEGFNSVQFEDKNVIKISGPPGEISGLVLGERKISLIRKSYCIDEKNQTVCQISWGKNKSSSDEFSNFNDYFCGKIVKLKKGTEFNPTKGLRPKQVQKQLGCIYGRFTQKVIFQNEVLFDVQNQVPYLMQEYTPCLASDSRYRKDIIYRKQNNYRLAQQAKEELQILQRYDKKLRKQC